MSIFGKSDVEFKDTGGMTIEGVLTDFGNQLQDDLIQSLKDKGAYVSGNLAQSIVFPPIKFLGTLWKFELYMEDYGSFIDEGVEGVGNNKVSTTGRYKFKLDRKPSAKHFKDWAYKKGINPFAVRESIFQKGLKQNRFYRDVVNNEKFTLLTKELEKAAGYQIAKGITKALKDGVSN